MVSSLTGTHIHSLSNPNDMWSEWKKSFLDIVDKHTPLRKGHIRGRSFPWITSDLAEETNA